MNESVVDLHPVDDVPRYPDQVGVEREESQGVLVRVAAVRNVQEVLAVPSAEKIKKQEVKSFFFPVIKMAPTNC